jgi:hypothetical protein
MKDPERVEKFRQYDLVEQFFGRFENPDRSLRGGWTGYDTPTRFEERLASDLRRFLRERLEVERVAVEKGVPVAPLRAVLARYGEHEEVPEDEIPARLARWAEEFATTREQFERVTNDRPEAGAARHRAAELLEASDLDGAQTMLAEARRSLRENRERTAREEAAILATRRGCTGCGWTTGRRRTRSKRRRGWWRASIPPRPGATRSTPAPRWSARARSSATTPRFYKR